MIVGKLKPNEHNMLASEKIFASGNIEFPHPLKAFVIEHRDPAPVLKKTHPLV